MGRKNMMVAVDTNILLRALLNDVPHQAKLAQQAIRESAPVFVSLIVCSELDYYLRKSLKHSRSQVCKVLSNMLTKSAFQVEQPLLLAAVLPELEATGTDLADLLIREIAHQNNCSTTFTFDKKASKRPGFTLLK